MAKQQDGVARGATGIYFSNIVSMFASTAHFVVLTNLLSTTEVGIISGIQIIAYLVSTLSNFALPQPIMTSLPIPHALSKFLPQYYGSGQRAKAVGAFRVSFAITLLLIIPLTALIFLGAEPIAVFVFHGKAEPFWIQLSSFEVLFFTLNQFFFAGLVGLGRSGRAGLLYSISLIGRFGLAALLVFLGFNVAGAIIGYIIGDVLLVLLVAPILFSSLGGKSESIPASTVAKFSFPLLISSLIVFGVTQIDKIFALFELGLPELGIYTVSVAAATIGAYAPNAFSTALVPVLALMLGRNDQASFKSLSKVYTRYVTLLGMPTAVMIAALALPLTRLFGPEYSSSAFPAAIISIAVAITSFTSVYNAQLIASTRVRWVMLANIAGLTIFGLVLSILVPSSSFVGAAFARAIMIFVVAGITTYSSYRLGYLALDKRALLSSIIASIGMGTIITLIPYVIGGYARQLVSLVFLVPLGIVIYILLLRIMKTFTVDDLVFIERLLPRRLKGVIGIVAKIAGVSTKKVENLTGQIS